MAEFNLNRGYDIPLLGEAEKTLEDAPRPERVALKPVEFRGIMPRLAVQEGDSVQIGSPLFFAKANEDFKFTSPASGKVVAINRGHRRALTSIEIECDGEDAAIDFGAHTAEELATLGRDAAVAKLLQSGLFALFVQRPFGHLADPSLTPRDIFISALDTAPLAADVNLVLEGREAEFQAGLEVCRQLTSGKVHLSIDGARSDLSAALTGAKNVELHRFSGPHPAGCVGVQIHHIAPISGRDDVVWTISPQGVALVGALFLAGRLQPQIVACVAGTAATVRKHFRTVLGVRVDTLAGSQSEAGEARYISGNVLTGAKVEATGYLGFYDNLLSVIPEACGPEFAGWMKPGFGKASIYRCFASSFLPGKRFDIDTRMNGGLRAFVATGYYEQVLPMDIYPLYLLKSILVEDIEEMEGLGIYEVVEEDFALCEYACPSKASIQQIIRGGLDLVEKEG